MSENGPWDLLARFRYLLGIRYDEQSAPYGKNVIARALTCVWCLSIWVALMFVAGWYLNPSLTLVVALPFALSSLAIILEVVINGSG